MGDWYRQDRHARYGATSSCTHTRNAGSRQCECGEYEEGWYAGAAGSHLQTQLLHVDIEGGGEGGLHDALLAIDQMCEDLSARKLP